MINSSYRYFRLNAPSTEHPKIIQLLEAEGFRFSPELFFQSAYKLEYEPFALGSSLAAFFGYIYIQDKSSMLPPLALNPQNDSIVLDMCSSPGSKTSQLARLCPEGLIIANEANPTRLENLRRNLSQLNLANVLTMQGSAEKTAFENNSFNYIQLDPPCSAWGTRNQKASQIWQDDKIRPLIALQKKALAEATRLLKKDGTLVYSTCTTNIQENEEMLDYAINELGLKLLPLDKISGFNFENCKYEAWKLNSSDENQGFFVTKFTKTFSEDETQSNYETMPYNFLDINSSNNEFNIYDFSILNNGKVAKFNDWLHYIPNKTAQLYQDNLNWQGLALGKINKDKLKFFPKLRLIMPNYSLTEYNVQLSIKDIRNLINGQSLNFPAKYKEINLFYEDLALCRLALKNNRLIMNK